MSYAGMERATADFLRAKAAILSTSQDEETLRYSLHLRERAEEIDRHLRREANKEQA